MSTFNRQAWQTCWPRESGHHCFTLAFGNIIRITVVRVGLVEGPTVTWNVLLPSFIKNPLVVEICLNTGLLFLKIVRFCLAMGKLAALETDFTFASGRQLTASKHDLLLIRFPMASDTCSSQCCVTFFTSLVQAKGYLVTQGVLKIAQMRPWKEISPLPAWNFLMG